MARKYSLWVVEDDAVQRNEIMRLIATLPNACCYDAVALEGEHKLKELLGRDGAPDIVLLDIDLGEGAPTGVDLAEKLLSSGRTQVVYTTAYLPLVTVAYRTKHAYTLAKPIKSEQLELALEKAAHALEALEHDSLVFAFGTGVKRVACSEIIWLESAGHRVEIHMTDGVRSTYESLRSLVAKLPASFARSHKSYVANLEHVRELADHELVMSNGSCIPVSRKYRGAFKGMLMEYLGAEERG